MSVQVMGLCRFSVPSLGAFQSMPEEIGASASVTALIGPGMPLVRFVSEVAKPGTKRAATGPISALAPNPTLPAEVRLQNASRAEILVEGGAKVTASAGVN